MADLLSAISIFLVFITFLLKTITEEMSLNIKASQPLSAKKGEVYIFKRKLFSLLFFKAIPITIVYLITAYTLLPKTVYVIKHGKIDLWKFDPLNTLFIFIECGIIFLACYAVFKTIQLILKIRSVI